MEQNVDETSAFRVPVAAAPAYLTATVAVVSAAGAVFVLVLVGYLLMAARRLADDSTVVPVFVFFPLLALGLLAAAAVMGLIARAEFRLLRNPPVFTDRGVRLRVFARRGYDVFVPWDRVSRLRVADKGARPYLMVEIADAGELAGGDSGKAERLRRTAERYDGAAAVYGMRGVLMRVEDLGAVVDSLSGGSVALDY